MKKLDLSQENEYTQLTWQSMYNQYKKLSIKDTIELFKKIKFNNDMVDKWIPENYLLSEACYKIIKKLEEKSKKKNGTNKFI